MFSLTVCAEMVFLDRPNRRSWPRIGLAARAADTIGMEAWASADDALAL